MHRRTPGAERIRRRVEKLWGARANFFYGSLECGVLGIECDEHDGYHVPEAHVLMESGAVDSMIPLPQSEKLAQMLREYGATVTFQKQPANHGLIREDLVSAAQWLDREYAEIKRIHS